MNNIVIYKDKQGNWCGFESCGHIGEHDVKTGQYSLVCCALSMHLQTIVYSLEKHLNLVKIKRDDKACYLKVIFKGDSILLLGIEVVFLNGLTLLKKDYKKYIKIHEEEVEYHV